MINKLGAESVPRRVASHPRMLGAGVALAVMLLVYSAHDAYGQCALARLTAEPKTCGSATEEELLPEDAYLASDKYTNRYFGFSIDLPISSAYRITIPVMLEKQHALLAIGFERGKHFGTLTITAEESPTELERYDDLQGEQCNDSAGTASQMRRPIPGGVLRYGSFYANIHRRGGNFAHHYWARIKSYIIRVSVDSNDQEFLKESKRALIEADFYCARGDKLTMDDGKAVVVKGEPYQGPTVPTWRVDAAIKDTPGVNIPAGEVSDGVYRNQSLGLQYELPNGWDILETEEDAGPPRDARALREYELLRACSRVLLHAVQRGSSDAAQQSQRPSIILRAMDPSCLSVRMPASIEDKRIADEMGANLELFSEFGEIKSAAMASLAGRLFTVFRGTVGRRSPGDVLSHRMSEAILATEDRETLLMWSLMAPTASELDTLPASSIIFDDSRPIRLPPEKGYISER